MELSSRKSGDIMIFDIRGRMIGSASFELKRFIGDQLAEIPENQKPKVIVNLMGVAIMDSSGLGTLVSSYVSVQRKGGRMVLAGLGRELKTFITITKLAQVFDTYENEAEAIKSFENA